MIKLGNKVIIKWKNMFYKLKYSYSEKGWKFRKDLNELFLNVMDFMYSCNELCNHASNFLVIYIRLSILSYFMLTLTGQYGHFNSTCR